MKLSSILLLVCVGCGHDPNPLAAAIPCRDDCSSAEVSCHNACNDQPSPAPCFTACAANELTCLKICEARFPADDSTRCKADCDRYGSPCRNGCSDNACRASCDSSVSTCKQQCDGEYP